MPGGPRLLADPRGGNRSSCSLRGTIETHGVRESGMWFWKTRIPLLKIRLNPEQVEAFNRLAQARMSVLNGGTLRGIAQIIDIGVADEVIAQFPVGAQVAVTFGYAGQLEQFFHGRDPLAVTNVQVITDDTVLEDEIEIPQTRVVRKEPVET